MVSGHQLLAYALASFVLIVIPGPGVFFLVGRALAYGRRAALATAIGHGAGNYAVAALVAFGLGMLVERSAAVFLVLKVLGALYLIWLGIQAIRHRRTLAEALEVSATPQNACRSLREGFVVGITNPKALILFGAVLPNFVDRVHGQVSVQMLLLSAVSAGIGLASDSVWAVTASMVRTWFARSPRRLGLVGGAGGLAMIGVGLTAALTGRRS